MTDSKPCPFCGENPTIESWHGGAPSKKLISCECDGCTVCPSITGETEDEAVERWNTRAALEFPRELTDELHDVLSTMLWHCGQIASALRADGEEIETRAEAEQAHVLHWLICLALEHGPEWRAKASERIRAVQEKAKGK